MLIMYRVVRGRDAVASVLPRHRDMGATPSKLIIRIGAATTFSGLACECSASPVGSGRGLDCPRHSFPPPYASSLLHESSIGIIPQSPSVDPTYMPGVQKLGIKRPVW